MLKWCLCIPEHSPLLAEGPSLVRDLLLAAAALGCNR